MLERAQDVPVFDRLELFRRRPRVGAPGENLLRTQQAADVIGAKMGSGVI